MAGDRLARRYMRPEGLDGHEVGALARGGDVASCEIGVVVDEPEPRLAHPLPLAVCKSGALRELVGQVHGERRRRIRQRVRVLHEERVAIQELAQR